MNAVLPLGFAETDATALLSGAPRAEQTSTPLLRLLHHAAAAAPLLILLEDIHWLDPTSWALLHQVVRKLPAMIVLTTRPPQVSAYEDYGDLIADPVVTWLTLGPLSAEELVPLVCGRMRVSSLAPEVAELILERADGNPYFAVELAALLCEAGIVRADGEVGNFAPGRERDTALLPDTLQGVIGYRLDQLAPEEQLTVKVASVIGRVFAPRALLATHPMALEVAQLYAQLLTAEQLSLVLREAPEPDPSYAFRHIIAQEVAYSLLPTTLQRSLHGAVARWLEQTHAADRSPYYLLLAYHWQRAGEPLLARDYLDLAGAQALRDGAYREARELLEQAEGMLLGFLTRSV